ncbi:glycosyltransferase family 4 protein [Mesorhizobium sp. SP-1A]|uniref:glycosyltransferase family 4 protein n=1 Tax=Mesorhizobium sp. SP-1A TaxID=3077840 RepID=UPI0028F6CFAB|nr:glycosyltransferase family 4 protein [Mesorhizobium sp. SP-1A]
MHARLPNEFSASRQPPLIVQVVRQYLPNRGGLEEVVANLSGQLHARGYRVRVVTLDRQFTAPDRLLPATEIIDGIEVVRIPFRGSTRYPVAPQVLRHIGDAAIVHVHAIDFFFDALAWTRPFHRKPMVATTHGGFFHTQKYASLKTAWFNTATRVSALAYKRLIGCSLQDTRTFARIAGDRVIRIDNGVDTGKFADAAARSPKRRLVTIGRFSVNKRLDNLLGAMQALEAVAPGWRLDIVGVPGDLDENDLARMVAERGLSDAVQVRIGLSVPELRAVLSECSLFASASDYEGFGLVAVEAMSAGLMPLLNPNTAYRDLAAKHPEIRLCDFGNPELAAGTIANSFRELSADPRAYRESVMQAASAYSWHQVAERYLDVYRELLREPASRPRGDDTAAGRSN